MNRGSGTFQLMLTGVALAAFGVALGRGALSGGPVRLPVPAVVWPWLVTVGAGLVLLAVVSAVRSGRTRLGVLSGGSVVWSVWFGSADLPAGTPARGCWLWVLLVGLVVFALVLLRVWQRRGGSAGTVNRWSRRSRRNDGVASWWQVLRTSSWWAARRRARVLRPSLATVGWWRRWRTPIRELATPLAKVGALRVWSPVEDVTTRLGGPRTGKTGELACRIIDAPGAVIATSTRTDLIGLTGDLRAKRGPVWVFNPSGLAGAPSTITFDPLSGCEQPSVAISRAADLISGVSGPGRGADREFWEGQGRRVLAALLHAAALGGLGMRDVQMWVANPEAAKAVVTRLLRRSPEPAFEVEAEQFITTNDRTRSSISATIMPALSWLTDANAVAAATGGDFDVQGLLSSRGTVFMLGAEDGMVAPLVAALTGHIARQARAIASYQPGGRLDSPLTLVLDEAALICPIPLDNWTADMGGRNVTIHIAAQSRAQLRQRWGDTGAAAILNNSATLLIFGGTRDADDLQAYSTLTGERDEHVETLDTDGVRASSTTRRVPVLSPAQIAQLPAGRAVVIRRGMPPAIGTVQMAWKRRDVRKNQARKRRAARAERWAQVRDRFAGRVAGGAQTGNELLEDWRARAATRAAARSTEVVEPVELVEADSVLVEESEGGEPR